MIDTKSESKNMTSMTTVSAYGVVSTVLNFTIGKNTPTKDVAAISNRQIAFRLSRKGD